MMSTSNTSKLKNYQFIRAFHSDRFTPDLPMFVNTKTITFITLSCADYVIVFCLGVGGGGDYFSPEQVY